MVILLVLGCVPDLVPPTLLDNPDHDFDGDGYTETEGDCNDDAQSAFPGADEVCGDGLDNDCDGTPNDCAPRGELSVADLGPTIWVAEDLADTGSAIGFTQDLDGDGFTELMLGLPGYHGGDLEDVGAILAWSRIIDDDVRSNAGTWAGPVDAAARFGSVVGDGGDFNGDGIPDVLCTGPAAEGGIVGVYTQVFDGGQYVGTEGLTSDEELGFSAVTAGDVDDDGRDDLLAGAPGWDDYGAVRIVFGTRTGTSDTLLLSGTERRGRLGESVLAPGDLDGDGATDLLAGAPDADSVWHLGAPPDTDTDIADLGTRIGGPSGSGAGTSMAAVGDVDGDGLVDVAIGAPNDGTVYILLSPPTGELADAWAVIDGSGEDAGAMLASPGDFDNDGEIDLAIGAPTSDRGATEAGAVYLFGRLAEGRSTTADAGTILIGAQEGEHVGAAVSLAGDVNRDGLMDLAVGAPLMDIEGAVVGGVYLVFGGGGY